MLVEVAHDLARAVVEPIVAALEAPEIAAAIEVLRGRGGSRSEREHEGFDVILEMADGAGDYELWVGWPSGEPTGCDSSQTEIVDAAWVVWY